MYGWAATAAAAGVRVCIILCARCKTEESYKKDGIAAGTGGRCEKTRSMSCNFSCHDTGFQVNTMWRWRQMKSVENVKQGGFLAALDGDQEVGGHWEKNEQRQQQQKKKNDKTQIVFIRPVRFWPKTLWFWLIRRFFLTSSLFGMVCTRAYGFMCLCTDRFIRTTHTHTRTHSRI